MTFCTSSCSGLAMPQQRGCADALTYRHGAMLLDSGATRFSIWAPDARAIAVDFNDGRHHPLTAQNDGWFSATLACGAGQPYHFLVDGQQRIPDPASRSQAGAITDASVVMDARAYRWRDDSWRGRPGTRP